MLTRNRIIGGSVVITAACLVAGLSGAGEDQPKTVPLNASDQSSDVMKDKLRFTHQLLTSLAREDFSTLEKNAQNLNRIARKQWMANPAPEYRAQLQVFWTTLEGIESAAHHKDIEEATLAYMQMTLSCVKCHKVIRRERRRQ